jgi:hypothetical protein
MTMRLTARGGVVRMMAPVIGRSVRRKLDADFARLKQLVESR